MAKKEGNSGEEKKKTSLKKSRSTKTAKPGKPVKSGKVKGPMGVGGPRGKQVGQEEPGKTPEQKETPKALPKPKKALPEHEQTTTPGATKGAPTGLEGTAERPGAKAPSSRQEKPPQPGTTKAGRSTKRNSGKTPGKEDEKADKASPKKMSRQVADPSISAEEKMKLPNTSPTEDLKETARATAQELFDKLPVDKEVKQEIERLTKEVVPDPEDLKGLAAKISNALGTAPEKAQEMLSKLLPDLEKEFPGPEKSSRAARKKATPRKEKHAPKPETPSLISDFDVHLFKEGRHYHLYKKFGAHKMEHGGTEGVYFAVWAPNAEKVCVMGDFNNWSKEDHQMKSRWDHSGIWELYIPGVRNGNLYKYLIRSNNGYEAEKGDPYAFTWETPPNTASMVWDLENSWEDQHWMEERRKQEKTPQAYSVYELHLGSWKRVPEEGFRSLSYRELAEELPRYLQEMGFSHVEFMPVMEHPFFGSWGYQVTGYFAPSSRFGSPQDFMYLIDRLHQADIGVILDWVPSHFPSDLHGLHFFDGTYLYEHADPKKGFHPDWQSYIFNYGRNEVRSFLISNALFWLDLYHADGLRVDAVASMLYLDYSRKEGEWEPNEYGGRENLEAISFLREFNEVVYREFPDAVTIAEESTAWPMVSKPTYIGGLGFGMKWMMGWMHDTLSYFSKDPVYRRHHQNIITFSSNYAFSENFMLPLSHDEVVYGKGALLNKMPGDPWNRFANIRSLYAYMFGHPGTKLLFMGGEFGQNSEWNHDSSLEWHLTQEPYHRQLQESLKVLNRLYRSQPALYEKQFSHEGFEWVDINDEENSIISFMRKGTDPKDDIMIVCNFTPVPRENYRVGVSGEGRWKEIFNSDEERFGGSDVKNPDNIEAQPLPAHQRDYSLALVLPPMAVIYLQKI